METSLLGVFDSGVGGFSVLKEVRKQTSTDILYYGDCLRAPYGNRKEEEIVSFIKEVLLHLKEKGVTYFVSACNSMSVHTTSELLAVCGIDENCYTDTIRAFRKHAVFPSEASVMVAATHATIASGEYERALLGNVQEIHVYPFETLAGMIERSENEDTLSSVIDECLQKAKELRVTHIVYGCTHYPLVDGLFKSSAQKFEWNGTFIDPAVYVAQEVAAWNVEGKRELECETSKETDAFRRYCDSMGS
jgi:glutamate racemase